MQLHTVHCLPVAFLDKRKHARLGRVTLCTRACVRARVRSHKGESTTTTTTTKKCIACAFHYIHMQCSAPHLLFDSIIYCIICSCTLHTQTE